MSRFPVSRSLRTIWILPIGIGGLVALTAASAGDDPVPDPEASSGVPSTAPLPAASSARTATARVERGPDPATRGAAVGRQRRVGRPNSRASEDLSAYVEVWPEAKTPLDFPDLLSWELAVHGRIREEEKPVVNEIIERRNAVVGQIRARIQDLREEIIERRRAEGTLLRRSEYCLHFEHGMYFVLTRGSAPAYFSLLDQLSDMRGMLPDDDARTEALLAVVRAMRDEEEHCVREGLYEARFDIDALIVKTGPIRCLALPNAEEAAAILELDSWIGEVQRQAREELRLRLGTAAK